MTDIYEKSKLKLDQLNTDLAQMRLTRPGLIKSMQQSLSSFGQLSPIIVRKGRNGFQIIDGFKRYYAAEALGLNSLQAEILKVTRRAATSLILTYNKNNSSLDNYEEALVLQCLKKEHKMQQDEIAKLVGHSPAWVSRRLALVEKLDSAVKDELKLGTISSTQAREIVKLPRGNQQEVAKCIIDNDLNTRQSCVIIDKFLQTHERQQQKYILDHPLEVIEGDKDKAENEYDCRLSKTGNRLLKAIKFASRQMRRLLDEVDRIALSGLTLLEWSILDPELMRAAQIAKKLNETINQIQEKKNER